MPSTSSINVSQFFEFFKVKISGQESKETDETFIVGMESDERYSHKCSKCGSEMKLIHSKQDRYIRDLSFSEKDVYIHLKYSRLYCPECNRYRVEHFDFVQPWKRYTERFALYVHELCKLMTISDVAEHLGLDWKLVKEIDKTFLKREYSETDYSDLRFLMVDEISIKKGHNYLTVVADYETGRVVWMGEDRKADTLDAFFEGMMKEQKECIEAVSVDMWKAYVKSIKANCPKAKIVYDRFHVEREFSKVIDKIRNREYKKASEKTRTVIKGSKYLLLSNYENLGEEGRKALRELLNINENISTAYILKEMLKKIWEYKYPGWARKALHKWCVLAEKSGIPELKNFAKKLQSHSEGILNHCRFPLSNGRIEGMNTKLKDIKRHVYGFHDLEYYILKCKQAFPGT